jgi:lysyl-tRNA synthetase class 2
MNLMFYLTLKPLPVVKQMLKEKHMPLQILVQRYRRRYVDLTVNDHVKATFIKRTKLFNAMRSFLMIKDTLRLKHLFTTYSWWCSATVITHHNS